jgi:hypothetical protein
MESGIDDMIVRSVDVMGDVEEVSGQSGETVGLADRIRIVIAAQRQRDLQVGTNAPLVLPVKPRPYTPTGCVERIEKFCA